MNTMQIRIKQGFHYGSGGNKLNGWGDWWQSQNNAGIPVNAIGADNAGPLYEIQRGGFQGNTLIYRFSIARDGFDPNTPRYTNAPESEAVRMLSWKYDHFPIELDPFETWLKDTNEIRTQTNPGDVWFDNLTPGEWWGRYALAAAKWAAERGFKVVLLSPSSGDYDWDFWNKPTMLAFLRYAIAHPDNVKIGLHEYSYKSQNLFAMNGNDNATVEDVANCPTLDLWKCKIGRFRMVFETCDKYGLGGWPHLYFCEFGWTLNKIPFLVAESMTQLSEATQKIYGPYYKYIDGFGTWYLGPNFDPVADMTNALLKPCANMAINQPFEVEEKKPSTAFPEPGKHKAIVVKIPQDATMREVQESVTFAYDLRHTWTQSHDDVKSLLLAGNDDSYVKFMDVSRDLDTAQMVVDLGYAWQPLYDAPPVVEPPPVTGETVDVTDWIVGSDRQQFDMDYGSGTQTTMISHQANNAFLYVKGTNGEYERLWIADFYGQPWIWRADDTSESPTRMYAHYRSEGGALGAPWFPCLAEVGRWYSTNKWVQHFKKPSCEPLNGGQVTDKLRLISKPYDRTYQNTGQTIRVITLEWASGEQYDFAGGNVGFRGGGMDFQFMGWLEGRQPLPIKKYDCFGW